MITWQLAPVVSHMKERQDQEKPVFPRSCRLQYSAGRGLGLGLGEGEGALQGTGVPGARLPLVREVVRDALDVYVRHVAKTIDWFPSSPFFRRFAGPWLVGRTGHCSLETRGRSVPLGVCLRRDSSCDFLKFKFTSNRICR